MVPLYVRSTWFTSLLKGLGFVLVLVLAGCLAWRFRPRRKGEEYTPPPVPMAPAHEVALSRLRALARKKLLDRGQEREFYFELCEIVREYLGRLYDFDALEMTTTEVWDSLDGRRSSNLPMRELRALLECGDLVKFAKLVPETSRGREDLDAAFLVIDRTRPRGPASAPPAAEGAATG